MSVGLVLRGTFSAAGVGAVPSAEPESSPSAGLGCAEGSGRRTEHPPLILAGHPRGHQHTPAWGQHCAHLSWAAVPGSGCPCQLCACGEGWVLWLMLGAGGGGLLCQVPLPPQAVVGFMGETSRAGFASLRPPGSSVPASPALPALFCWEAWRGGLRMGIAAQVSKADNYFWGKDAVF